MSRQCQMDGNEILKIKVAARLKGHVVGRLNLHLLMGIILVVRNMMDTNQNKTSTCRRPPFLSESLNSSEQKVRDSGKRKTRLLVVSLDATHRLRLGCAIHLALPVELMGVVTQNRDWNQIRIAS